MDGCILVQPTLFPAIMDVGNVGFWRKSPLVQFHDVPSLDETFCVSHLDRHFAEKALDSPDARNRFASERYNSGSGREEWYLSEFHSGP